jgi:hypothetical protein
MHKSCYKKYGADCIQIGIFAPDLGGLLPIVLENPIGNAGMFLPRCDGEPDQTLFKGETAWGATK